MFETDASGVLRLKKMISETVHSMKNKHYANTCVYTDNITGHFYKEILKRIVFNSKNLSTECPPSPIICASETELSNDNYDCFFSL